MAVSTKLNIEKRDNSKNPRQLRAEGLLTGTVYGKGIESVSVQLNERDFVNTYKKAADATFSIELDGKTYDVVVAQLQKNYGTNDIFNVEFKIV